MPYQQSYPVSQIADAYTNVTGYRVDPVSGKLTTISVPVPFLYGGKWTMGVGAPTVNGVGTGDSYMNVQNGDVYSWDNVALTWGAPVGTLINGTYQVPVWVVGKPLPNEILYSLEAPGIFIAQAGMTDSVASADTAATAQTIFSITQNGAQIATVTFAAGSSTGVIACAAQVIFQPGDVMNVVAPATVDATLSNIRMTLGFTRPSGAAESDIISSGQAANSATQAAASAATATAAANNAGASATMAQNWASQASGTVDGTSYSAKFYAQSMATSVSSCSTSAENAATSEANALSYRNTANTAAGNASTSAANAHTSEVNAAASEANAAGYASSALLKTNNLSDLPNPATARSNLGVGMTKLSTGNLAGQTSQTIQFPAGYDSFMLVLKGIKGNSATARVLNMQYSTDGGSTWVTSGIYGYGFDSVVLGTNGAVTSYAGSATMAILSGGLINTAGTFFDATVHFEGINSTTRYKSYHGTFASILSDSQYRGGTLIGLCNNINAVNAMKLFFDDGSAIPQGTWTLYAKL